MAIAGGLGRSRAQRQENNSGRAQQQAAKTGSSESGEEGFHDAVKKVGSGEGGSGPAAAAVPLGREKSGARIPGE
ncbi:hypothetical protein GCM10022409_01790 [Hymenobacter glaciei]|uniref:Uncharacterized protein n=1 Tax=Hymenobacter glaciei TaxID=877209 RepID=A0ABP7T6E5_9BACT